MNYEIIKSEEKLKDFINWLPDLADDEIFFVGLYCRSKYDKSVKDCEIRRFTSKKEFLFEKIQQLECPLGAYRFKGVEISNDALALYINPTPRNVNIAAFRLMNRLSEYLIRDGRYINLPKVTMSEIQKAKGKMFVHNFDIDKDYDIWTRANAFSFDINGNCVKILRTRGGFHILVEVDKIEKSFEKIWYKSICKLPDIDSKRRDDLIPVPGCNQGGFIPYFMDLPKTDFVKKFGNSFLFKKS